MFWIACITSWHKYSQEWPVWKKQFTSNYVMIQRENTQAHKNSEQDGGADHEFKWTYLMPNIIKKTKFVDVNDPKGLKITIDSSTYNN